MSGPNRSGLGSLAVYLFLIALAMAAFGTYIWITSVRNGNAGTILGACLVVLGVVLAMGAVFVWTQRNRSG